MKHAPLLWSSNTCCNLHVSFICRGCSDQHHGLSHCIPFAILNNTPIKNIYVYILPCYNWSKSIDFVKIRNDFKCFVINLSLLTGHFPDFRTLFLRSSLCVWSNVHRLSKWSIVWSPLLQEHVAFSIILNRWR